MNGFARVGSLERDEDFFQMVNFRVWLPFRFVISGPFDLVLHMSTSETLSIHIEITFTVGFTWGSCRLIILFV